MLAKWSNLQLEVKASVQYAEVISDLLTYSTLTVDDVTTIPFHKSLVAKLELAQKEKEGSGTHTCG